MKYVFDSGPLIDLFRHYYPQRFPTLWENFGTVIGEGRISSVSEVLKELEGHEDALANWGKSNRHLFYAPQPEELDFVTTIFEVEHFQGLVKKKERLQGKPVADPFVIAKAMISGGCVVTTEKLKPNSAQIPNVCAHFKIECVNLEGFMEIEGWKF